MDKLFKKLCSFLSFILIASTIFLTFAIPIFLKSERETNFFSSEEIAKNILNMELNMTSIVYVKNEEGKWVEYQRLHGDENRIWIGIDKMPQNLQNAFIAIEDERFKRHSGVDWKRTIGAVSNYYLKFNNSEFGGSTITQQLIKNVTLDKGKNADRKFREIIRALSIEKYLSKNQILEAYLNTISLGTDICGVQVAANYYFNKNVSDLNLTECAALAAITQNPSKYNPVSGVEGANKERRNTILSKMLDLGMITKDEYYASYDKDIVLDNSQEDNYEPEVNDYFIDALIDNVITDLSEKYNCNEEFASTMLYNGGYKIYATLDQSIQQTMENVYLNTDKYFNIYGKDKNGFKVHSQSAMTIMDYEGHIVGIVGGAGEKVVNRGLNRATLAPRQPGSTMKPIGVYALAIENDLIHYSSKVLDKPIANYYGNGKAGPREWYGYYKGTITVDTALRTSANTIPVRLLQELGIETSYDFLKNKLHCKYLTEEDKNLSSLALGGSVRGITTTESAAAFAIFGSDGIYHKPTTYYKIERSNGDIVIDYDEGGERVISSATATIMNHLLQGVVYGSGGTGSRISSFSSTMKAYAKTGTSSDANDLWMVAGTPYYIGSVWYGFDLPQKVSKTSGAAEIWRDIMKEIHQDLEPKTFVDSPDVYKKGSGYYKKNTVPDNIVNISGSKESSSAETSSSASSINSSSAQSGSENSGDSSAESSSSGDSSTPTDSQKPPDNEDDTSAETKPSSPEQENPTESPSEKPSSSTPPASSSSGGT